MGKFSPESNLIIQFDPDGIIERGTSGIVEKAESQGRGARVVTFRSKGGDSAWWERAALTAKCCFLPDNYRLYLRGHGSWQEQSIGGWRAYHVAELLKSVSLPKPAVVSVTGCNLGRDYSRSDLSPRVMSSMDSFGSKLHKLMKQECGLKVDLFARAYCVGVDSSALRSPVQNWGRKGVFLSDYDLKEKKVMKMPHSKLHFYWNGDSQMRKWADDDSEVIAG